MIFLTVKEWLGENNQLGIDIWEGKYKYKDESFDDWVHRVSGGDFELAQLIRDKIFLMGGRTLSNRGLNNGSYFNCYSSGFCPDDFKEIMQLNSNLGMTYKYQGGQGVSLSKLRPKGAPIGDRYYSDGIIPFLELFNKTTAITSQAGSRKGALMVSLDIRHKQAEEFIKIKTQENTIDKANLSLEIDNEFMLCVQKYYETGEIITLHEKRKYNKHIVEYDITPINLYKTMMESAWDWGEPGCIFTDEFRNYNLMEFVEEYQIETSNPCGEQPLPKNFCCNLGSINVANLIIDEYSKDARIDYELFQHVIRVAISTLDKLIDENKNNHPLQEQKINSINYRNIGLGLMGVGTALFKLGIKYGSKESINLIDELFSFLFRTSVKVSNDLARVLGAFPRYNELVWESNIVKNHFSEEEILEMKEYGLRNCSLVSIAPTGSISTMIGVTGGCEPEFSISYTRRTENLKDSYVVYCNEAKYYMDKFDCDNLPEYFVCSSDIKWKDRIDMQAEMQKHVDTAISSTVNLPNNCSLNEIEELYLYAWKSNLKGITVFRDGCKRFGILIKDDKNTKSIETESFNNLGRGYIIQVDDNVIGRKRKLITGCGSLHCEAFFDPYTGELLETYFSKGSSGGCNNFMIGLSRMISLASRGGIDIHSIVDQLNSCGVCPSYAVRNATKHDASKGSCCPMAIGNALMSMYEDVRSEIGLDYDDEEDEKEIIKSSTNHECPECGEELFFEGGCNICKSCGWSKCD